MGYESRALGQRSKQASRCEGCHLHENACLCSELPVLNTRTHVALVMHTRESRKPSATGPLALRCLPQSSLHIHGLKDAPLDLSHLAAGNRLLILTPSEHARVLSQSLIEENQRPITLVVPDGNWRQASRIPKRVRGLDHAEHVILPQGAPSAWGLRRETREGGLATFEAIARALGILESHQIQVALERVFARFVAESRRARQGRADSTPQVTTSPIHAPLPIIHQDDDVVVINKPSGLQVHRGWARDGVPALQQLRDQLGKKVYPAHRLDRSTSGALVFALKPESAAMLQTQAIGKPITSRYVLVCRGRDSSIVRIDHPLSRVARRKLDQDPSARSEKQHAVTDVELLGSFERYGFYLATPETGRTHQIRRHFKYVAQPLIGDVRYGKGEHNRLFRQRFGFHRLALHCIDVSFIHPSSGEHVRFSAPPTSDLDALLSQLKLRDCLSRITEPLRQGRSPGAGLRLSV